LENVLYSRINSTQSPASGAGDVSKLMSQAGRLREVVYACISVFLQSEQWQCQYTSAYIVTAILWMR